MTLSLNLAVLYCTFWTLVVAFKETECTVDSDCKITGCTCLVGLCTHYQTAINRGDVCPPCKSDNDCIGENNLCTPSGCGFCAGSSIIPALEKCYEGSGTAEGGGIDSGIGDANAEIDGVDGETGGVVNGGVHGGTGGADGGTVGGNGTTSGVNGRTRVQKKRSCSMDVDCSDGCSCIKLPNLSPFCAKNSVLQEASEPCTQICSSDRSSEQCLECGQSAMRKARKACTPQCISSQFLFERGLEHSAIRHHGVADVLCIPGLPCGTPGHLLRECSRTSDVSCRLVSYDRVCRDRKDCIQSRMPVSQLKHSHDWSVYRVNSGSTSLSLTSLSADPEGSLFAPSYIVAKIADTLNAVGLGFICDSIVSVPHKLAEVRTALHMRDSRNF